jgi:hypothetical protein
MSKKDKRKLRQRLTEEENKNKDTITEVKA